MWQNVRNRTEANVTVNIRIITMTRRKLAIFFASALALLWSYEIATTLNNGADLEVITVLGLGFALGLLIVELRSAEKDTHS